MRYYLYILIGLFTFIVGVSLVRNNTIPETNSQTFQPEISYKSNQPRFQHLRGFGSYGDFKSSGSKPRFVGVYCVACGEVGDISVFRDVKSTFKIARRDLEILCGEGNKNIVERSAKLGKRSQKIEGRCIVIDSENNAHIFWTKGNEFWSITANSLELAGEFENSEVFKLWQSKKNSD